METVRSRDPYSATLEGLRDSIASGRTPVLQFNEPPAGEILEQVNAFCRAFGADLQVRFYGFRWQPFDTSVLRHLPDVQNLSIDTMSALTDFAPVAALSKLTRLRFGVHEHPDGQFLNALDLGRFTHLNMGENKRRNFDLTPLRAARNLEQLFIQGHHRGIEVISHLPKLQDVSLSGFPKRRDLAFLNDLAGLKSLLMILGSRESIAELTHPGLRKLKIVWVRLLEDLGRLDRFSSLDELIIEDQVRLTALDLGGLKLRRLHIANCKRLERIESAEKLGELEHFFYRDTKLPCEYRRYVKTAPAKL